jgi:5-methylcytosine-specific restriction endonuclease McrA
MKVMQCRRADGKREFVVVGDRKCQVCGAKFTPHWKRSRFCSRKCGKKDQEERNRGKYASYRAAWYAANKERISIRRKERYWANPEKARQDMREYHKRTYEAVTRPKHLEYLDQQRHAGKRKELLDEHGYVCQRCGEEYDSYNIVAHHITGDPHDHAQQELLCRPCHLKEHNMAKKKGKKKKGC